ncbi:MAG: hypothetical protein GF334_05745 [Candidatus Altiarchaeales archaeon]|nr:hypothetical protein [Candidatus Altiarchaeales archaeon]
MIVADSSSLISLAMNCLCPVFDYLDKHVAVTPRVYGEVVTKPLSGRRFRYEAYRIKNLFDSQILSVEEVDAKRVNEIMDMSNSIYSVSGKKLKIIHPAEAEAFVLCEQKKASAFLIDERTMRLLLEDPDTLRNVLEHRNHKKVSADQKALKRFQNRVSRVPILRSTEILALAYEHGFFPKHVGYTEKKVFLAAVSALKLSGCAITWDEVEEYDRLVI